MNRKTIYEEFEKDPIDFMEQKNNLSHKSGDMLFSLSEGLKPEKITFRQIIKSRWFVFSTKLRNLFNKKDSDWHY